MITVDEFIKKRKIYEGAVNIANLKILKVIAGRKLPDGSVSDEVRNTDEYKKAKLDFDKAFNSLREFHKAVPNKIKRDASAKKRNGYISKD